MAGDAERATSTAAAGATASAMALSRSARAPIEGDAALMVPSAVEVSAAEMACANCSSGVAGTSNIAVVAGAGATVGAA